MKFALLGIDDATLVLAQAVAGSAEHSLVGLCEVDESPFAPEREALYRFASGVPNVPQWESLLDERMADAVLVARSGDSLRLSEQLRKLVQTGRPLIVSHPLCDSMVCYEADMARSESKSPLVAHLPERYHPAVADLGEWLKPSDEATEGAGAIEQCVFERTLSDRSQPSVYAQFARDVDLLRSLAGDITRLAAFGPPDLQAAYATLQVQMTSARMPTMRWSVAPVEDQAVARLTISASAGKAILTMPSDGQPWTLLIRRGGNPPVSREYPDWQPAAAAIERFVPVVQGQAGAPVWMEAIRSIELAEAIERSLRRGRAVEIKVDEASEESNFKGTMAAAGCCTLLFVLMLMLVAGIVGDWKGGPAKLFPGLLLGLLLLFLAMQFLIKLTRSREGLDKVESQ